MPKYLMNNEIKKYPIYALTPDGTLEGITKIISCTDDYNHYLAELHHYVPFTDWLMNTKEVRNKVEQKLILLPRACHQHLENPIYRMPKSNLVFAANASPSRAERSSLFKMRLALFVSETSRKSLKQAEFKRVYKINPDAILYDVNSKNPRTYLFSGANIEHALLNQAPVFLLTENDLSCIADCDSKRTVKRSETCELVSVGEAGGQRAAGWSWLSVKTNNYETPE